MIELTGAVERACTLDDLARADEVFLASTLREVQSVAAVNEISFERIGPVTGSTAEAFSTRVQAELSSA